MIFFCACALAFLDQREGWDRFGRGQRHRSEHRKSKVRLRTTNSEGEQLGSVGGRGGEEGGRGRAVEWCGSGWWLVERGSVTQGRERKKRELKIRETARTYKERSRWHTRIRTLNKANSPSCRRQAPPPSSILLSLPVLAPTASPWGPTAQPNGRQASRPASASLVSVAIILSCTLTPSSSHSVPVCNRESKTFPLLPPLLQQSLVCIIAAY